MAVVLEVNVSLCPTLSSILLPCSFVLLKLSLKLICVNQLLGVVGVIFKHVKVVF